MTVPDDPFTVARSAEEGVAPRSPSMPQGLGGPDRPRRTDAPQLPPLSMAPLRDREADSEALTGMGAGGSGQLSGIHTPGGGSGPHTAGTGGTKTPRRVQWNNESHIVQLEPEPDADAEPGSPQTVGRHNLTHIDAALERHRSSPRRPQFFRQPSDAVSRDGTEGTEEDYDYRLDVDPVSSARAPPTHGLGTVRSNESRREGEEPQSLADILDNGINDHSHGETLIPLGETDGLPTIGTNGARDDMDAAKNLVRAHTGKWGVLRRRVKGANNVAGALGKGAGEVVDEKRRSDEDAFAARYPEPERDRSHGHGQMPGGPGAGGASVLSSLLALYNQQNMPGSGATSAASSRPSSVYESSDEDESRSKRVEPAAEQSAVRKSSSGWWNPPKPAAVASPPSRERESQDVVINEETRRPSVAALDLEPPNLEQIRSGRSLSTGSMNSQGASANFLRALRRAKGATVDKASDRVKAEMEEHDRPKHARSGAGVFGALIQNTQNLSGAATPTAATLAPAASRPGYQLTRYTLPTGEAPTVAPWRPASRASDRDRSRPTSVHSSTAYSNDGSSPVQDIKKNHSSDDMLSLGGSVGERKGALRNRSGLALDQLHKMPLQAVRAGADAIKSGGHAVRNAEKWVMSGGKTPLVSPPGEKRGDSYFGRPLTEDERKRKEWEAEKRKRKKAKEARKKQEIFIIQHVAAILARQQFLMKLARALMMFGSPSHRLETQLQATARVLELNAQVVYLPGIMLLSFGDDATHTSETKFLKQATGLDLGKLLATHRIYWNVVHDRMSVEQASKDLDMLMTTPVYYSWWQTLIIGALASSFITVNGFYGSFIDGCMAAPLGALLCGIQMLSARNDMFSNVFEIAIATIISFIAAGLASTGRFCYTALVSGGVVLILPGYIVLCGALELAARNITAGAVRIGYSVIYSLFLGFGISLGAEMYRQITGLQVTGSSDFTCSATHNVDQWFQVTPSAWWYFLCCPGFALMLSLRNQQPIFAKELPVMVIVACAGWASNHFTARVFVNRSDMTSAIGSFVVGTLGNMYGKLSKGSSFPVTVVGILMQLPSGLSNGGIFNFAAQSQSGSTEAYSSGFEVAQQLVSVAIGLTVGLFVSAAVTHPFGGGRRRGSGIFSF